MFSDVFLAMTAGEMGEYLPPRMAYMACHFSPYTKGLSNLPPALPENSILLLDDSMPPDDHDPAYVAGQLKDIAEQFSVKAVVLDFQKEKTPDSEQMVRSLLQALCCPVAVTEAYAKKVGCPVFLSPLPANKVLDAYLAPWKKQGIYLELAPDARVITVTKNQSITRPAHLIPPEQLPQKDSRLCCHYAISVSPQRAEFTLCRTGADLAALTKKAYAMGVLGVIGLYQELCK